MPAFFFFLNTPSPLQTVTTTKQQKFLRHFLVGSHVAGLTLRGKQKTLVARQPEQPQPVCPEPLCCFKEPVQKSNILYGASLSKKVI